MSDVAPDADLAPVARLLGRLLVREIDEETVAELQQPDVREALAGIGIGVPQAADREALATGYFERFLHPAAGLPPVQSLWQGGQYDGDPAVAVRAIAAAAGRELAPGARGAAPDHLGCILLLWADLAEIRPELAARLQRDHLAWAVRALAPVQAAGGFYGAVAAAAVELVHELLRSSS